MQSAVASGRYHGVETAAARSLRSRLHALPAARCRYDLQAAAGRLQTAQDLVIEPPRQPAGVGVVDDEKPGAQDREPSVDASLPAADHVAAGC